MRKLNVMTSMALGAAMLAPALAMASGYKIANGEAGIIFLDTPGAGTTVQARAESPSKAVSSGWQYVGGEAGWTLDQAMFVFTNGKLLHASDCPLLATSVARPRATEPTPFYSGA